MEREWGEVGREDTKGDEKSHFYVMLLLNLESLLSSTKKRDMSCWRKREGLVLLLQRQRLQGNEKHSNWTFKRVIVTTGAGQHCTGERKIVNRMKAFLHYSKLGSIHMAEHTICSWENDGKKKQEEKKKERKNKQFSESGGKWHRLWHWLRYLVVCCNWFVFMFFSFFCKLTYNLNNNPE